MVIVVVGVVILLISLAAFGFLTLMQTENIASAARGDQLQAAAVAMSGREFLAAWLERPRAQRSGIAESDDASDWFAGVLVDGDEDARDRDSRQGRFSIVAPHSDETATRAWRFGYENESAKLHLGRLVQWERWLPGSARTALLNLPGMDESVADALLDWIDADDVPREQGAESEFYRGLQNPVAPRNAVPPALEELLLVRGVTRERLFGLDLNANFRVDRWEEDLARSEATAGSDRSALPWSRYLTLYSGERDETYDGQPRIPLNQPDLGALHRDLGAAFNVNWANFAVAFRQHGPYRGGGEGEDAGQIPLDLSAPPQHTIRSPLELIGVRVAIPQSGGGKPRIFDSPLSDDSVQMRDELPRWMDGVTVIGGAPIYGRVNVNLAPPEVLAGVPGIDAALAQRIVTARRLVALDDPSRRHAVWLLTDGLVDRAEMARLDRFLTTGGDVARCQIIGYYDARSPVARFETIVDGTDRPARQVYYKDLRRLGRGALEDVMNVTSGL